MNQSHTHPDDSSKPTVQDAVRAASDQYYEALEALLDGDAGLMADIWSHENDVTTMHLNGGREEGWETVHEGLEGFASAMTDGTVTRTNHVIRVTGTAAYELYDQSISGTFAGDPISLDGRVTNVYRRENGEWKAVHHHADIDAELVAMIANMSA